MRRYLIVTPPPDARTHRLSETRSLAWKPVGARLRDAGTGLSRLRSSLMIFQPSLLTRRPRTDLPPSRRGGIRPRDETCSLVSRGPHSGQVIPHVCSLESRHGGTERIRRVREGRETPAGSLGIRTGARRSPRYARRCDWQGSNPGPARSSRPFVASGHGGTERLRRGGWKPP